jgi:hypothetical protein
LALLFSDEGEKKLYNLDEEDDDDEVVGESDDFGDEETDDEEDFDLVINVSVSTNLLDHLGPML